MKECATVSGICPTCGLVLLLFGEFEFDQNGNTEVCQCDNCESEVQLRREEPYE